jgi:hypothetical protein
MSRIAQQLPALLGVAVGALASYLAGAASERMRWRRDQSVRWDDKRAQAYTDYGLAVKNVYAQSMRAAELRRRDGQDQTAAYEEALAELGRLTDERTAKWETVLLLGQPETIAAARYGIVGSGRWSGSPVASAPTPASGTACCPTSSQTGRAFTRRPGGTWASQAATSRPAARGKLPPAQHQSNQRIIARRRAFQLRACPEPLPSIRPPTPPATSTTPGPCRAHQMLVATEAGSRLSAQGGLAHERTVVRADVYLEPGTHLWLSKGRPRRSRGR